MHAQRTARLAQEQLVDRLGRIRGRVELHAQIRGREQVHRISRDGEACVEVLERRIQIALFICCVSAPTHQPHKRVAVAQPPSGEARQRRYELADLVLQLAQPQAHAGAARRLDCSGALLTARPGFGKFAADQLTMSIGQRGDASRAALEKLGVDRGSY